MMISLGITLLIAILSGMGVGGGDMFVIYLSLLTDTPQLTAQGINLLFFLFAAASSLLLHIMKRKIYGGIVLILSLCGIVGSLLGSFVAANLSSTVLGKIFGGMLVVSGLLSLRKRSHKAKKSPASRN